MHCSFFLIQLLKYEKGCDYMEIQYEIIGQRIKQRRKELHIKQMEMAEHIEISNNHMSSIENGREKPSLEILLRICEYLDVTPDYLLLGNMHADNVPKNIMERLRACDPYDLLVIQDIIEAFIERRRAR